MIGPDGRGEGTCPDCGHGYSTVAIAVFSKTDDSSSDSPRASRRDLSHAGDHRLRKQRILRERPFEVFGLDARWTGLRWMGGWGTRDDEVEHITLAHGDPFDESAPLVRVSTWRPSPFTFANAATDLAHYMWMDAGAPHELVRPAFTSEDPTTSWSEFALPVDDHPTPFRSLAHAEHWVAVSKADGRLIALEARRLAPTDLALTTVQDIEPYFSDPPSDR